MRSTPALLTRGLGVLILDAVWIDPMPKKIPSRVACLIMFGATPLRLGSTSHSTSTAKCRRPEERKARLVGLGESKTGAEATESVRLASLLGSTVPFVLALSLSSGSRREESVVSDWQYSAVPSHSHVGPSISDLLQSHGGGSTKVSQLGRATDIQRCSGYREIDQSRVPCALRSHD